MKTPQKERRPSLRQRQAQSPDQGYDEERDLGEIGYIEPRKPKSNYSREEQLKRAQSAAREEARKFWSFFDRFPGLWDELPENERAIIKDKFAYREPVNPPPGADGKAQPTTMSVSTSGKRRRRTHAQVISDLADEHEQRELRRAFYQKPKGRPRVKYAKELAEELARRAESRAKGGDTPEPSEAKSEVRLRDFPRLRGSKWRK